LALVDLIINGDQLATYKKIKKFVELKASETLKDWWNSVENEQFVDTKSIGWLKIAWVGGFILTKQQRTDYKEVMKLILEWGGDTDTNACIIGGIIGAAIGIDKLPGDFVSKLIYSDPSIGEKARPEIFQSRNALKLASDLFREAPDILLME
jgi:ADP-ribosyl-[dinitrogen reductase] hydrolase